VTSFNTYSAWLIVVNRSQRNATDAQKWGKHKTTLIMMANCTSRHFRFATWQISSRLVFVAQSLCMYNKQRPRVLYPWLVQRHARRWYPWRFENYGVCCQRKHCDGHSVSLIHFRSYTKEMRAYAVVQLVAALQAGMSRVRFPMVSLNFFIDIILPAALWPWGCLSL
jgi:hypothetical protein